MKTETKLMPPKIVKAPEGCESYLTPGKEYEIVKLLPNSYCEELGYGFLVRSDDGGLANCIEKLCAHLMGQDWIIVEREKETP